MERIIKTVTEKHRLPALDFVDYVGGCCGSDPSYIRELAARTGK